MSDLIATKVEERILTMRINRPEKKNALLLDMYTAMSEALSEADGNSAIRAVCITGTDDVFTSGNDIGDFQKTPPTGADSPVMVFLSTIAKVTKTMLPFFGAMIAALLVITYVPAISLWLPVQTKQVEKVDVEKCTFMRTSPDEEGRAR